MSGGSYGYLCFRTRQGGLGAYREELAQMAGRLTELGHHGPARYTREVLRLLDGAELIADSLTGIWQAVEWQDSGDGHAGQVTEAVAAWVPVPSFPGAAQ